MSRNRGKLQRSGNAKSPGPEKVEFNKDQNGDHENNDQQDIKNWACLACTLLNSEKTIVCRLCNTRRESTRIRLSLNKDENVENPPANGLIEKQSESAKKNTKFASFEAAMPSYTHRALTHLILHPLTTAELSNVDKKSSQSRTYLHHIVTQNVDGLHRKSRLPRQNMSILHGDIFTEVCDTCGAEHVRTNEIQSIGRKHTGRFCTLGSCSGKLIDTLLDWEDDLPEIDWKRAQKECKRADLVVCLGTSLRIEPAGGLCTYATYPDRERQGRCEKKTTKQGNEKLGYVIVNLQETPYDEGAVLVIRGRVDDVMKGVMEKLGYSQDWEKPVHALDESSNT